MSSLFLQNYSLAEPTIRKLYDSKLRMAILEALGDGPKRLSDLRRIVDSNAPNTSTKAKDLEDMGLIERIDGDYALTPYGRAVRSRAQESFEFYATYAKFREFWESHDTSAIPDFLWARLGDLNNSTVVKPETVDLTRIDTDFLDMLKSASKFLYGMSPVYHDEYLKFTDELVGAGLDIKYILTDDVLRVCAKMGERTIRLFDQSQNFKLYGLSDAKFGFIVSEKFFSLLLIDKGGTDVSYMYMGPDLRSTDPKAIRWGIDLFDYYAKKSHPAKLRDYK